MGRKKITIAKIDDEKMRQVTFQKRKSGLLKKSMELSLLCEVKVVLCVMHQNEKMTVYYSDEDTIHLFEKQLNSSNVSKGYFTNSDYKVLHNNARESAILEKESEGDNSSNIKKETDIQRLDNKGKDDKNSKLLTLTDTIQNDNKNINLFLEKDFDYGKVLGSFMNSLNKKISGVTETSSVSGFRPTLPQISDISNPQRTTLTLPQILKQNNEISDLTNLDPLSKTIINLKTIEKDLHEKFIMMNYLKCVNNFNIIKNFQEFINNKRQREKYFNN